MRKKSKTQRSRLGATFGRTIIAIGLLVTFTAAVAELHKGVTSPSTAIKNLPVKKSFGQMPAKKICAGVIEGRITASLYGSTKGLQVGLKLSAAGTQVRRSAVSGANGDFKFAALCAANYTITADTNNRQEIEPLNYRGLRLPGAGVLVTLGENQRKRQNIHIHPAPAHNKTIKVTLSETTANNRYLPRRDAPVSITHRAVSGNSIHKLDGTTNTRGEAEFNVICCGNYDIEVTGVGRKTSADVDEIDPARPVIWEGTSPWRVSSLTTQSGGAQKDIHFKRQIRVPPLTTGATIQEVFLTLRNSGFTTTPRVRLRPTDDLNLHDVVFAQRSAPYATFDQQIELEVFQTTTQARVNSVMNSIIGMHYKEAGRLLREKHMIPKIVDREFYGTGKRNCGSQRDKGKVYSATRSRNTHNGQPLVDIIVCGDSTIFNPQEGVY
ncbi:MAG: hypothetical protein ABW148_15225 [Sedimenticola sp.]